MQQITFDLFFNERAGRTMGRNTFSVTTTIKIETRGHDGTITNLQRDLWVFVRDLRRRCQGKSGECEIVSEFRSGHYVISHKVVT